MAASAPRGLSLAAMRRVRQLWREPIRPLTLAELRELGSGPSVKDPLHVEGARRTHHELKLRIAHRLRDFLFLPAQAMSNPSLRGIYDKYTEVYTVHEELGEPRIPSHAEDYWRALARAVEDHKPLTQMLGRARRQLVHLDPQLAPVLDGFCGRFFASRLGTHLLGANFLHHAAPLGAQKPAGIAMGVLQPTSPTSFVHDLSASLSAHSHGCKVPVEILGESDISIVYIPSHLRVVLREILRNAMVATARTAKARGREPEPVRVQVNRGRFGVFVTVSDHGGGIRDTQSLWRWGLTQENHEAPSVGSEEDNDDENVGWSDCEGDEEPSEGETLPARLFPLGFGLPLARLTVRYFGGDLRLQTLQGHGTNAYIHIPELQESGALGVH